MKNPVLNVLGTAVLVASLASSMAFAGGVGDGGGKVMPERLLDSKEITGYLAIAKPAVRAAIHRFEYFAELFSASAEQNPLKPVYMEIRRKLFLEKKTIYDALEEARFSPLAQGNCLDLGGEREDASVINAPDICFSLETLEQQLHEHSGQAELIALAVHEVSHLVGTTEEEAKLIQGAVQSSTSASPATTIFETEKNLLREFDRVSEDIKAALEDSQSTVRRGNDVGLCMNWGFVVSDLTGLQSALFEGLAGPGIIPVRPQGVWEISAAIVKAANIMSVCYEKSGKKPMAILMTQPFGAKSQMRLNDFYKQAFKLKDSQGIPGAAGEGTIRRVYPFNKAALQAEITDMLQMVSRAQAAK